MTPFRKSRSVPGLQITRQGTTPTAFAASKILRFATIGPVKAGWIVKDSGRWYITDEVDALIKLWVQHYDKLGQQAKLRLPLRPVYLLALDE